MVKLHDKNIAVKILTPTPDGHNNKNFSIKTCLFNVRHVATYLALSIL